jgi:general secretion pathway protein H
LRITSHESRVTIRARNARGFTLVEILVVVLLIGLTVSLVTLRIGNDPEKLAQEEARRLAALIEHLRDESIQTGSMYALEFDPGGRSYRFLRPAPKWQPVKGDSVLRPRALAEPLQASLETPGTPPGAPAWVVAYPSGELSPFRLKVGMPSRSREQAYIVQLEPDQTVRVRAQRDAG